MFNTKVKKDKLESYLKYHRAVWPEVMVQNVVFRRFVLISEHIKLAG